MNGACFDLDTCRDPGLLVAYCGKWEKADPVWSYRAQQRVVALEAAVRTKDAERIARATDARRCSISGKVIPKDQVRD